MESIAPVLERLAIDWPGVAGELGWIMTRHPLWENKPKGAIAAAESISGEKIAFNPFYFQNLRRIRRVVRKGVREGFYPRGADRLPMDYLVSHEWPHLVSVRVSQESGRTASGPAGEILPDGSVVKSRITRDSRANGRSPGPAEELGELGDPGFQSSLHRRADPRFSRRSSAASGSSTCRRTTARPSSGTTAGTGTAPIDGPSRWNHTTTRL